MGERGTWGVLEGEENGKIRCGVKREWKESEWSE